VVKVPGIDTCEARSRRARGDDRSDDRRSTPICHKPTSDALPAPTGERLGFGKHIGWHTFRHSYRSWMNDAGATPEQQRDLMRHTDIATTLNIYGGTFAEPLRLVNSSVV